jgi:hypothetical protein
VWSLRSTWRAITANSSVLSGSAQEAIVWKSVRVASSAATVAEGSSMPRDRSAAVIAFLMPASFSSSRSRSSGFEATMEFLAGTRSRRAGVNQSAAMPANAVSIASDHAPVISWRPW